GLLAAAVGTLIVTGAGGLLATEGASPQTSSTSGQEDLARVDRLEDLLLRLTPQVDDLDGAVLNLALPDATARRQFAATVTVVDLAPAEAAASLLTPPADALTVKNAWPVESAPRTVDTATLRLWRPVLDQVDSLRNAHFKIVRGRFPDADETRWVADVRFDAVARLKAGGVAALEGKLELSMQRDGPAGAAGSAAPDAVWKIDRFETRAFNVQPSAAFLFSEVLDRALPDAALLKTARTSRQEELIVAKMRDPKTPSPSKYFQYQSLNQHPGIAVADVDRDGFDDLYVMERWGTNLLLHNKGNGTFEEIAAKVGLDVTDHSSSALFADFDNDGDLDLFLGRTLAPSLYFVNEAGKFKEQSKSLIATPLPALVSSVSAADIDGDGLLDVYFSTYAIDADLQADFLSAADRAGIQKRWASGGHLFKDRPGPPNLLLRNMGGGRFAPAPGGETLAVFRNTFQSTWSDYDGDGDPDVYLANDFAPNNLFRNDGGRFTDVTEATGTADIGFGMGASWGDYDNDGRQDLYVTNMYSTAGRRITAELNDPTLASMARGNSLLRNAPDRFVRVSGLEPPALTVERAGWGWGSQFVDVDNDGWLDIHALSGYYTSPPRPGSQPDL
ncbi:MAG TPA: VCBS repeat-containing protein, partial [Dongiaceae bacterium]|nr:VCBS repeat-containing protein [Dongiaceae bacterium]